MIGRELQRLIDLVPFEPFRIKLANGDYHDIFYPQNVAVLRGTVHIMSPDQNWTIIPFGSIACLESLIADYHGQASESENP